jgi:hypothetical protein
VIRLRRLSSGPLALVRLRSARALRRAAEHLEPPRRVMARAVVADGYAQGRADLQLVHGRRYEGDC